MNNADNTRARYGVDIRGHSMHAEMNDLNEIFALLRGKEGFVHVTDRTTNTRVFEGSPGAVVDAIRSADSALVDA